MITSRITQFYVFYFLTHWKRERESSSQWNILLTLVIKLIHQCAFIHTFYSPSHIVTHFEVTHDLFNFIMNHVSFQHFHLSFWASFSFSLLIFILSFLDSRTWRNIILSVILTLSFSILVMEKERERWRKRKMVLGRDMWSHLLMYVYSIPSFYFLLWRKKLLLISEKFWHEKRFLFVLSFITKLITILNDHLIWSLFVCLDSMPVQQERKTLTTRLTITEKKEERKGRKKMNVSLVEMNEKEAREENKSVIHTRGRHLSLSCFISTESFQFSHQSLLSDPLTNPFLSVSLSPILSDSIQRLSFLSSTESSSMISSHAYYFTAVTALFKCQRLTTWSWEERNEMKTFLKERK